MTDITIEQRDSDEIMRVLLPKESPTYQIVEFILSLLHKHSNVNKVVLDLVQFNLVNDNDIDNIVELLHECATKDLEFQIINSSKEITKSLLYHSLEFLEVIEIFN